MVSRQEAQARALRLRGQFERSRAMASRQRFLASRARGLAGRGRFARGRALAGLTPQSRRLALEQIRREQQIRQARELIKKSREGLAALTKEEKVKLEKIIKAVPIPTRVSRVDVSRMLVTSPRERLQLVKQKQLEAERTQLEAEQDSVNLRADQLQARFIVLERLSNAGQLQPKVAEKFNKDVNKLQSDQSALIEKSRVTESKIKTFLKPTPTRIAPTKLPKTAAEFVKEGIPKELRKVGEIRAAGITEDITFIGGVPFKKISKTKLQEVIIAPKQPFGVEPFEEIFFGKIPKRIGETLTGAGKLGAGLAVGGLEFGAGLRAGKPTKEQKEFFGSLGRAAGITFGAGIAVPEAVLRETFGQTVGLGEEVAARFFGAPRKPLKFEITEPTAKGIVTTIGGIPIVGGLTGFQEAITPEGIFFTRPVISEFATTVSILGAQFGVPGKRVPVTRKVLKDPFAVRVEAFFREGFRIRRPTLKFKAAGRGIEFKLRPPTAAEKFAQFPKIRARPLTLKTVREVTDIQIRATQAQLAKQIARIKGATPSFKVAPAKVISKEALKFGKIKLPKVKQIPVKKPFKVALIKIKPKKIVVLGPAKPSQVKILRIPKLGEKGAFLPGRPRIRPTGIAIQIPKPKFLEPIKLGVSRPKFVKVRITKLEDILKQLQITRPVPPPRFPIGLSATALLGRAVLTQAEREALRPRLAEISIPEFKEVKVLREAEKFRPALITGLKEIGIEAFTTREIVRAREKMFQGVRQKAKSIEGEIVRAVTRTVTIPETRVIEIEKIKVPEKPRRPPPGILFPRPSIEAPKFAPLRERKVEGFVAFVKEKPFRKKKFRKVSKPLSKEAALQRGFFVADQTIAQSVRLQRSKKRVKPSLTPFADLSFKFRKKGNTFIEKRRFAIDTLSEKQELSVDRFLAMEKRRGLGLFGVAPRKKKRRRRK